MNMCIIELYQILQVESRLLRGKAYNSKGDIFTFFHICMIDRFVILIFLYCELNQQKTRADLERLGPSTCV